MDKILDISDIFGLNVVSLGVTVILLIIVGFIAIFRGANKKNVTLTNKPNSGSNKKSEGKESRKLENNVINESGKKKKRAINEKETKTNNVPTVKKETKNNSPKKQANNTATPVNKNTKQKETPKDVKAVTPKPKKNQAVPEPAIEDDGWQTVTKKQKKQNEPAKAAPKENLKASPKKNSVKNKNAANDNKIAPPTPEKSSEINSESTLSATAQVQDPEWTENKPTKKNKKRALRE